MLGWFAGLARYAVPVALVAVGVALVRKGQSSNPARLVIGWGLRRRRRRSAVAHVVNGPDRRR